MDWIKVDVSELIYSDYTDSQIIAILKSRALCAFTESMPNDIKLKRVLTPKQFKFISNRIATEWDWIQSDLKSVVKKRGNEKKRYQENKGIEDNSADRLSEECKQSDGADKIRLDKTKEKTNKKEREISFDLLWNNYKRKEGRKDALKHFLASVKNEKDYSDIQQALDNYNKYIDIQETEHRFIKQGSTWFNNWKDWVEFDFSQLTRKADKLIGGMKLL